MRLKRRVWEILDVAKPGDVPSRVFNVFILSLIFLNLVAVIIESIREIEQRYEMFLHWFEIFSLVVFSIEYLARLWSCVSRPEYSSSITGRLRFMARPMSIIDLFAVLPFYLPFVHADLRFVRALRLFRIFRVAKLGRYSSSVRLFGRVFKTSKEELLITLMVLILLVLISSSFMYFAENEAQPDKFPNIPSTMWWSVVTLTTVGYGDVYPVTSLGKLFAAIISITGIGMFALPTGILGANFVQEIQRQKFKRRICPHCGKEIE
jgi:voltage-gated potassium channel